MMSYLVRDWVLTSWFFLADGWLLRDFPKVFCSSVLVSNTSLFVADRYLPLTLASTNLLSDPVDCALPLTLGSSF